MKKFVNDPKQFVPEMLKGIALANPDTITYVPEYNLIMRSDAPNNNKVSIVQGSGSGHEPAHVMAVGPGMLDAACPGDMFAAPPADYVYETAKRLASDNSVLRLVNNYTVDPTSFEVAPELGDLTRFAIEEILGNILASPRWITGHELPLRELRCAYPAPAHAEVYRKYFACPIRFDAPDQQLRFDAGFLDTPLPQASSHAARMYRQHCRALINRDVREHDELVGRIRELTVKAGGRGMPLDECAASLSLSARTLRRKLQERGLSYQQIIDEVRSGLARTQLLAPRSSVEAVATRLGFSEAASFSRAFKRWTGMSPRQFRARGDSLR